jgi:hypothetical protein
MFLFICSLSPLFDLCMIFVLPLGLERVIIQVWSSLWLGIRHVSPEVHPGTVKRLKPDTQPCFSIPISDTHACNERRQDEWEAGKDKLNGRWEAREAAPDIEAATAAQYEHKTLSQRQAEWSKADERIFNMVEPGLQLIQTRLGSFCFHTFFFFLVYSV